MVYDDGPLEDGPEGLHFRVDGIHGQPLVRVPLVGKGGQEGFEVRDKGDVDIGKYHSGAELLHFVLEFSVGFGVTDVPGGLLLCGQLLHVVQKRRADVCRFVSRGQTLQGYGAFFYLIRVRCLDPFELCLQGFVLDGIVWIGCSYPVLIPCFGVPLRLTAH